MSEAVEADAFPTLYLHKRRKEWGVSVVSGEHEGKRRFLFEGGEERTISAASLTLMERVERPDQEQQAAYTRLAVLLARRGARSKPPPPVLATVLPQLAGFRERYPGGFLDNAWLNDPRRQQKRAAFEAASAHARELFSQKALDGWLKLERYETIWTYALDVLGAGSLADVAPVARKIPSEQIALLAKAIRKLLYATSGYEHRFDGFVAALDGAFGGAPSWELATALPALISPLEHVCVEPALFRRQLKLLLRNSTLGARPSGTAYARCAAVARTIARELGVEGEVARDLLDVTEFARVTVAGAAKPGAR